MGKSIRIIISSVLILILTAGFTGCSFFSKPEPPDIEIDQTYETAPFVPDEDATYTSMSEVAAYIHEYKHLPDNYISKKVAKKLGWDSEEGNLWKVAPGKSIGGDSFGNREGLLPSVRGRNYYECDIDYRGGKRNSKRLVYSNDGLIFYTEDHYKSYEQIY